MAVLSAAVDAGLAPLHRGLIGPRRARVLSRHLLDAVPPECGSILDVGCGDGAIGRLMLLENPRLRVTGVEVHERPGCRIPVQRYDGHRLPLDDVSRDVVMLVDVLHHADDPAQLLAEAVRVARRAVIVKDHVREGVLAAGTLRFMNSVGNHARGVPMRYDYWTRAQWTELFRDLPVEVEHYRGALGLYAWPMSPVFDRSLLGVARLGVRDRTVTADEPA